MTARTGWIVFVVLAAALYGGDHGGVLGFLAGAVLAGVVLVAVAAADGYLRR